MSTAKEWRNKSVADLEAELLKLRRAQFNLRMQAATDQGARPNEIRNARKDIARLKTVLREKQIVASTEAQ